MSGDVDYVVNLAEKSRSDAIDEAKARAAAAATAAGALSDTITVTALLKAKSHINLFIVLGNHFCRFQRSPDIVKCTVADNRPA